MSETDWKKPALIGGLIVALPAMIPFVRNANILFFLWSWVGGIVAVKMLSSASPRPLVVADGAKIGLLTGLIGGAIYFVVEAPITAWRMDSIIETFSATPTLPPEALETFLRVQQSFGLRVGVALVISLAVALLMAGFTVLGGMLGVAIFEKRSGNVPPGYTQ